jgi:single-strand DNA-binding protein
MAFDSKGTLNKVMLIGRLGADPELKYLPNGSAVVTLSLATDTAWKDQEGKAQNKTEWHRVIAWRKLAENVSKYAKKGSRIYAEGKLTTRSWNDKDGVKRFTTEIQADQIQFLDSRTSETSPAAPLADAAEPAESEFMEPAAEDADDLPF